MIDPSIRIERAELFDPAVDKALARERAGRERIVADAPPVSRLRRVALDSMFYLPFAAVIGALVTWLLLEPRIHERAFAGGEISLVNAEPFDMPKGILGVTVGNHEVLIDPSRVKLEPGAHGEPALASVDELKVGARVEITGVTVDKRMLAVAIRPTPDPEPRGTLEKNGVAMFLLFPLTAALIAFALLAAEGITTRNWRRMIVRTLLGSFLAALFALLAFIPAAVVLRFSNAVLESEVYKHPELIFVTIRDVSARSFLAFAALRSMAWACIGAATGFGMNLVRASRGQLRNSVIGGALGGSLGGLFFDPIDRYFGASFTGGATSRCVGLLAVGLAIGVFVALVERLAREAWLRVRTGPLAGKSFILYKTPSVLGSAPDADVYLYKDADIDPSHVAIHRVGTLYEIEDLGTRTGTSVGGERVQRRRLASGDQIVIGSTILDFEERQKRTPAA